MCVVSRRESKGKRMGKAQERESNAFPADVVLEQLRRLEVLYLSHLLRHHSKKKSRAYRFIHRCTSCRSECQVLGGKEVLGENVKWTSESISIHSMRSTTSV